MPKYLEVVMAEPIARVEYSVEHYFEDLAIDATVAVSCGRDRDYLHYYAKLDRNYLGSRRLSLRISRCEGDQHQQLYNSDNFACSDYSYVGKWVNGSRRLPN